MTDKRLPDTRFLPVGDIRITALSDGPLPLGHKHLVDISSEDYRAELRHHYRDPDEFRAGLNAFLIEAGETRLLVDAGCGGAMGPKTGRVIANLRAAGVAPAEIDVIFCTHMHGDHIGGLVSDGAATFPNAGLRMHAAERAHWADEANATDTSRAVFAAYGERLETFEGEADILPGLTALPLPGHTPGHSGLQVSSGDDALLIWTDIVHIAPVQLARPDVGTTFDVDVDKARQTRREILARVAADRSRIAGSHIGFPGAGWIERQGDGYRFIPAPYIHDR